MSVSTPAHPPTTGRRTAKLWIAILFLVLAGVALAWVGAQSVRARTVQVETLTEGTGPLIKPEDGVFVEYEGRLPDGTVFDSSAAHGGPQPMIAGQVIPGFAQALSRMQKGGRYKIKIPSDLAYGADTPPGGPIPPNSDLEFDVHIAGVVPNAAMMAGGGAPPPGQQVPPPTSPVE